jgi:hypothetical protein
MLTKKRVLDSAVTGALGYALMLGFGACMGGSSGSGGIPPDGGYPPGTGGGSFIPAAHAEQSGSRLKARRFHAADGSSQFETWVDTARGDECAFYQTVEGKRRCLPTGTNVDHASSDYFADPGCTVPIARVDPSCAPLKYVLVPKDDDQTKYCSGSFAISSVHQAVSVSNVYYRTSSGECSLDSVGNEQANYAAADVVPLTDFVEAQPVLDP